jgi:hypothetical protein
MLSYAEHGKFRAQTQGFGPPAKPKRRRRRLLDLDFRHVLGEWIMAPV